MSKGPHLRFGLVPPPIPGPVFAIAEAMLIPAMDRSPSEDWDDLLLDLNTGHRQLWIARDEVGVVASVTVTACDSDDMEIELHAGRLETLPFLQVIEDTARLAGIRTVTVAGRRGWVRVLRAGGYELTGGPRYELRKVLRA